MNQNQKILFFCIEKRSQKEIAEQLKWTKGATSIAIKRLVEKKLLKKIKRGIYHTTKKGTNILSKYFENEKIDLDSVIGLITTHIMMEIVTMEESLRLMHYKDIRHDEDIIHDEIRKILFESVINNHKSINFTIAMWQIHKKHKCDEHGFDFQNAFSKNSKVIKKYTSAKNLFNEIHYNLLPMEEQFKRKPRTILVVK